MPLSLRISADREEKINRLAKKTGKTKTAIILEAVDEKLGITSKHKQTIRDLAGYMTATDAQELRNILHTFDGIHDGDWE